MASGPASSDGLLRMLHLEREMVVNHGLRRSFGPSFANPSVHVHAWTKRTSNQTLLSTHQPALRTVNHGQVDDHAAWMKVDRSSLPQRVRAKKAGPIPKSIKSRNSGSELFQWISMGREGPATG